MSNKPRTPEYTIDPDEHPVLVIQRLVNEVDRLNAVVYDLNCQSLKYHNERDEARTDRDSWRSDYLKERIERRRLTDGILAAIRSPDRAWLIQRLRDLVGDER